MAAAALYRSRGAAGVRAIKGPFFIFTLLCLVGIATSHTDKEQMEKLKKNLHKAQEQMESLRAKYKLLDTAADLMSVIDPMAALVGRFSKDLPDDFPSMDGLLQGLEGFMKNFKTYIDEQKKVLGEKIEDADQKLRESWKLHELFEEQKAEL